MPSPPDTPQSEGPRLTAWPFVGWSRLFHELAAGLAFVVTLNFLWVVAQGLAAGRYHSFSGGMTMLGELCAAYCILVSVCRKPAPVSLGAA